MTTTSPALDLRTRSHAPALALLLGRAGGGTGIVAGAIEVAFGSSVPTWIGNKHDPTRLGVVTIVLSMVGLLCSETLRRGRGLESARRLGLVTGIVVPAIVCFTTVGRLWYVPGALLLTASVLWATAQPIAWRDVIRRISESFASILVGVLGVYYIALGATALGRTGLAAIVGGVVVVAIAFVSHRVRATFALATLVASVAPFALLTWWSVVTPTIAVLAVLLHVLDGHRSVRGAATRPDAHATREAETQA
jgi:hypothetical protein